MRAVSPDPAVDAELERKFFEDNQAAYADLRNRGLLPPEGQNIGSQDINEYLLKGGEMQRRLMNQTRGTLTKPNAGSRRYLPQGDVQR